MLFHKLYNWIKYKTLPPSILFKNRLFIERDSKNRRIFNNFGLTFRNSKWSSYASFNVSHSFQNNYFLFFLLLCLVFLIFKFFSFLYFVNTFLFFFWLTVDALDYYISFIIWAFSTISALFINSFFSFLINKSEKNNLFFSNNVRLDDSNNGTKLSKQDLNWFLYSWLNSERAIHNEDLIEKIFESKSFNNIWSSSFDFYINLYKSVFFLNLNSENLSFFKITSDFKQINSNFFLSKFLILNDNSNSFKSLFSIFSDYYFFKTNDSLGFDKFLSNEINNNFYSHRLYWNLDNFSNLELNSEVYNKNGIFYLFLLNSHNLSFLSKNNNVSNLLKNNFKSSNSSFKWDRWLYKYSLIHRKSLKTLNKFSNIKKSLNSGIFDKFSYNKNLWISNYLKKNPNLIFLFNDLYEPKSTVLNYSTFSKISLSKKNSFESFNFYDNSYSWFLKRFYTLNTISSNFFNLKSEYAFSSTFNSHYRSKNFFYKKNYLENFFFFFLKNKSNVVKDLHYSSLFLNSFATSNSVLSKDLDVFLIDNEYDFFSKDFLQNFIYLTSNTIRDSSHSLIYLNLNFFLKPQVNKKIIFKNNFKTSELTFFNKSLTRSLLNYDCFSLGDLKFINSL